MIEVTWSLVLKRKHSINTRTFSTRWKPGMFNNNMVILYSFFLGVTCPLHAVTKGVDFSPDAACLQRQFAYITLTCQVKSGIQRANKVNLFQPALHPQSSRQEG